MVNAPVIARRELNSLFLSPIAYLTLTAFALANGIIFGLMLGSRVDLDGLAEGVLGVPMWLLVFAAPMLTMRLLSEERNHGTIETLMTTPVRESEVVLGKFMGAILFAMVMYLPLAAELIYLRLLGRIDVGPLLAGFLGLFFLTSQFLAVGLLCSALTRVQIGAAITSFVLLLGLTLLGFVWRGSTALPVRMLRYLSPPSHFAEFVRGMVDTRHVTYFVVTTLAALFLTVKALELRKWR